ncbi:hypothetical protein ASG48_13390 [Aurantimonas sp. Leaf443]|nr:hypothetical protein ASG48_13390 [Aurantimonas sp. Leaf443]
MGADGLSGAAAVHPLQLAAQRLADQQNGKSRLRAKDLVGLLLCHGARAWRASQPQTQIRIRVVAPGGPAALRLRLR